MAKTPTRFTASLLALCLALLVSTVPSALFAKGSASAKTSTALEPPADRLRPRTGPSPCMTPDPGFRDYDPWEKLPQGGQFIAPQRGGITDRCEFDLVVHFHGHEPARKEFVKTAKGQVLLGVDLGIGSGIYEETYADASHFEQLLSSVEASMARRTNKPACHVRKLALSSWSAGYGAVWKILTQPAGRRVDTLILLDSLHAGYQNGTSGELKPEQLAPFVEFARQAKAGRKLMFLSHSSIIPPGYGSTTEVARYIVAKVQGRMRPAKPRRSDPLGLELYARYDQGGLHVLGFGGNDKPDHCAHLGLMANVMREYVVPRWHSPRAVPVRTAKSRR